ncbi:hypothetical protein TTHERM_001381979, partial (macronuclear) [Tetrahymena thermophila SB210]
MQKNKYYLYLKIIRKQFKFKKASSNQIEHSFIHSEIQQLNLIIKIEGKILKYIQRLLKDKLKFKFKQKKWVKYQDKE